MTHCNLCRARFKRVIVGLFDVVVRFGLKISKSPRFCQQSTLLIVILVVDVHCLQKWGSMVVALACYIFSPVCKQCVDYCDPQSLVIHRSFILSDSQVFSSLFHQYSVLPPYTGTQSVSSVLTNFCFQFFSDCFFRCGCCVVCWLLAPLNYGIISCLQSRLLLRR